ncbi:impB/mucB/samB family protein [Candida albicans]|uniref:ImpB/mucB/samB family protein n=1 Tax=Candida albicans TaxID=5476 RepID=A0A8H6F3E6_CANAX|nr:impB/mucB/samB family protein [Candida albicans]
MSVKQETRPLTIPLVTNPEVATTLSKFTFQNLDDLNDPKKAYLSPLATIALIDLNAFFAQVEQIRLNLTDQDPVVCAQWNSVIAVSYASRKFGITRMDTIASCKSKCPNVIIAHAAVYKKGESHWAYVEGLPAINKHKVSLDPYRRESRKILRVIGKSFDLTEKASVDECYIDLGREIYKRLIDFYANLPLIPPALPLNLKWEGEIINTEKEKSEDNDIVSPPVIEDWDDICFIIGSQILLEVAKLAAGFKKPDAQTIIRNSAINSFLTNFELTDVTGMGGKLGESIINKVNVPPQINSISFIRENFSDASIKEKLGGELGLKVYNIVRGINAIELQSTIEVKSMTSTKNFTSFVISNLFDAYDWLKVFAGDLHNRLIDLDSENMELSSTELSNKSKGIMKRPKTLTLGVLSKNGTRQTRQMQIPIHKDLDKMKDIFFENGCVLLREFLEFNTHISLLNNRTPAKEIFIWDPKKVKIMELINMSLTISKFVSVEDRFTLLKTTDTSFNKEEHIAKLFRDYEQAPGTIKYSSPPPPPPPPAQKKRSKNGQLDIFESLKKKSKPGDFLEELIKTKKCSRCKLSVDDPVEHNDYHIAMDLSNKLNNH